MAYLDVSPMITALRTQASDFELSRGWLKHAPSRHRFKFDKYGNVTIDARCDCAMLSVAPEQGQELWQEFQVWRDVYWRPVEINREFASHFRAPNAFQRILRRIHLAWRRATRNGVEERLPVASAFETPADSKAKSLAPAE
jgi:hypothetical protein